MSVEPSAPSGEAGAGARGFAAGLGANVLWGFLPILFALLQMVDAVTVIAHRTVWSLLLVGIILMAWGRTGEVKAALRDRSTLVRLAISALLLAANWLIYVWAVQTGHVLEASFGYFINPMVNVLMGMVLLGERQTRRQAVALVIAAIAIVIQAVGLGGLPFVSLGLALSFGLYGYCRKMVRANSATGLMVETLLLTPLALAYIAGTLIVQGPGAYTDPTTLVLLVATGPATAAPLLFYAFAVQRLRLTTIGMLQYVAPSIQFVLAITWFNEQLNPIRLVSFVLIWASLALFSLDALRRPARSQPPLTEPA